jgi:ABC-type polysaccharide/polyol phosphate export permease
MNIIASLAAMLAWEDVKQAYRRSALGPFWITASMAVQIGSMGVVFGFIFRIALHDYLPFLACSLMLWSLIISTVNEGCLAFISSEAMIKQLDLSLYVYVWRVVLRNLITFAHNIVIVPIVFLVMWHPIGWQIVAFLPGLILVVANLSWITVVLGIASARFRDVPQTIAAIMTIIYFITPIMWQPTSLPSEPAHWLLGLNPFYHFLQLLRLPILSSMPTLENWAVAFATCLLGWTTALIALKKFKSDLAFWV